MYQTIKIAMKNSKQVVWEKDEWDDYLYDGKFFIINVSSMKKIEKTAEICYNENNYKL